MHFCLLRRRRQMHTVIAKASNTAQLAILIATKVLTAMRFVFVFVLSDAGDASGVVDVIPGRPVMLSTGTIFTCVGLTAEQVELLAEAQQLSVEFRQYEHNCAMLLLNPHDAGSFVMPLTQLMLSKAPSGTAQSS